MLLKLFSIFFKLGFFAFGGGYSIVPLVEREVVEKHKLVDKDKFYAIISVSEGLPGAIALNISIFIGYMTASYAGSAACALGSVLPSFMIITLISVFFSNIGANPLAMSVLNGIRPVVIALIVYAAMKIAHGAYKNYRYYLLTIFACLIILTAPKIPIPALVVGGLLIGLTVNWLESKSVSKKLKEGDGK